MSPRLRKSLLTLSLAWQACFWASAVSFAAAPSSAPPMGNALLVGNVPPGAGNYSDIAWDLDKSKTLLSGWNQTVLYSMGPTPATELNAMKEAPDMNFYYDDDGNPLLIHKDEPGAASADLKNFEQSLKKIESTTPANQPLLVYFSGHGGLGFTEMGDGDSLKANDLKKALKEKNPNQTAVFVFDTCQSASMLPALIESKNSCGFAAARPDEYSRSGQLIMDEATSMTSMNGTGPQNFSEVVHQMQSEDDKDSLEMATSDYFLEQYYDKGPDAKKVDGLAPICTTDAPNSAIDAASDTILKTQLASIQEEIQKSVADPQLKDLKISSTDSYASLQSKVASLNDKIEQLHKQGDPIDQAQGEMSTSFIKSQLGSNNWKKYSKARDKLDKLHEKLETESDPAVQKDLQNQINSLTPTYEMFRNQVSAIDTAINFGDQTSSIYKQFSAFCTIQKPDFDCPANIVASMDPNVPVNVATCDSGAEALLTSLAAQRRPLLRLSMQLKESKALEQMESTHDTQAIQKYLELIQCESTPFKSNPWPF